MATISTGGYGRTDGTWVGTTNLAFSQAAVVATGNDAAFVDVGYATVARLNLVVAAIGGTTPSYTVSLDTSPDGTTWTSTGNFGAVTANGTTHKVFSGLDRYLRLSWTVTGTTPTATLTVTGGLHG